MIRTRSAEVLSITRQENDITEGQVSLEGEEAPVFNYDRLTGPIHPGDRVLLNTTAVHKGLGTGGKHFVMANLSRPENEAREQGHIMKLRYSPSQVKVMAVEEQDSPFAELMSATSSLGGTPVIVGTLHSMLAPAAAAAYRESTGNARLVYVMTDGAALPLPLSNIVRKLKEEGLIQATVTSGHAFGGDWEAINVYTALLAAKAVAGADIIIVTMGPGIVGSASQFGFTGVEQGEIINAVNILAGTPVAIPRISFADPRERHYGLSHHTRTALGKIALTPCRVPVPRMTAERKTSVRQQMDECGITARHTVEEVDGRACLEVLNKKGIHPVSMGRTWNDDPEFFLSAAAAGTWAARLL